jgi:hypothetical protein
MNVNDFEIRHEVMEYNLNNLKVGDLINPGEAYYFSVLGLDWCNQFELGRLLRFPGIKVSYIDKDYILRQGHHLSIVTIVLNRSNVCLPTIQ